MSLRRPRARRPSRSRRSRRWRRSDAVETLGGGRRRSDAVETFGGGVEERAALGRAMWSWTLNWSEIRSDIVVGSCPMEPEDLDRIRTGTGATAVLSVQSDACLRHFAIDYAAHRRHGERTGLVMRRVAMRDFDVEDQRRRLPDAVRALAGLLSGRHRVYAHCTAGLGRSPLVVAAYLAWIERLPEPDAMALVKSRRRGAVPSPEALAGSRGDLVAAHRAQIEERAWRSYRRRVAQQLRGDAETDWLEAERDVLRGALASGAM